MNINLREGQRYTSTSIYHKLISLITLLNKKAIVLSDETGRELKKEKGKRWI